MPADLICNKPSSGTSHDDCFSTSSCLQTIIAETEDNDALLHMAQSTRCYAADRLLPWICLVDTVFEAFMH